MAATAPLLHRSPDVKEIHVVWMTTGLGCDGDSVSITAATLPSVEDLIMGAIPGLPKVHLHNPVLAYEVGDDFMKYWHQAAEGKLEPFVLVMEGSVPNLCHLWRDPRYGRQSNGRNGSGRLPWLELAFKGGTTNSQRPRLPGSTG